MKEVPYKMAGFKIVLVTTRSIVKASESCCLVSVRGRFSEAHAYINQPNVAEQCFGVGAMVHWPALVLFTHLSTLTVPFQP
jgi:hypothetical protein